MEVTLIRDSTIGTPLTFRWAPGGKLRSGPVRIGSTPFCAVYETGASPRTLILRLSGGAWLEAGALAGAPNVAVFPDGLYLQYAYSLIDKMDETGTVITSIAGPTPSQYYPFALARLPVENQLAVLYRPSGINAGKLWIEGLAEVEAFPAAGEAGGGISPAGCALDAAGGLHMVAAAAPSMAPVFAGAIWYRAYTAGSLGTLYTVLAAIGAYAYDIAAPVVTSDGRIYVSYITYGVGGFHVMVSMSTIAHPETWTVIDVGVIAYDYSGQSLLAVLAADGKTLHLFWAEDPDGDNYFQDCYESHGKDGVLSAPVKIIGTDEFPVIQTDASLYLDGAGVVASNKIGLLFTAGNGTGDVWHTFYGEVDSEPGVGSGARYRAWVI